MCGILGYSHLSGSLPAGLLTTGLEALAHRGPDHQGTFYSERISLGAGRKVFCRSWLKWSRISQSFLAFLRHARLGDGSLRKSDYLGRARSR